MHGKLVVLYEGDRVLGEVELHPQDGIVLGLELKEIRISHYSPPSERCPPLAVLHTTNSAGICLKLESIVKNQDSPLSVLHGSCLRDNKTAVVSIGGEEIHLVAMHSRKHEDHCPCFWGFKVASSLYNSCLVLLNLRCLGIVFDLDETLIVANTLRSFEDRIEALQRKINSESDPQRVSGILAEIKRYQDDKNILKQYADSDQVIENGKAIKSQTEVAPALSDNHQPIVRPLIRLQDRNIILTRINPLIRDTSVLVRLRPAWEDLRNYLTAKGRKRFEVFVCTMAERDYALEMWRLLDPESNLINSKELLERVVCVKSGSKKSLCNVFQDRNCHPKMALVIDDRLKVWDEKDQPRVHVVPAFAPYYAPQAEANNTVPVLCVARNVACNVRGGFFKEFDDGLLQRVFEVAYEDDIRSMPSPPDVSNYLISEEDPAFNGNKDLLGFDGMADAEMERRLKEAISASSTGHQPITNLDPRIVPALQYMVPPSSFTVPPPTLQGSTIAFPIQQLPQVTTLLKPSLTHIGPAEITLRSSPAREEGEVPESELDPDTRRRTLILQHGQDMREHPPSESQFPALPPMQVSAPRVQPHGWFPVEEEMSTRQLNRVPPKEFPLNAESLPVDSHQPHSRFLHKVENFIPPGRVLLESQRLPKETLPREDLLRLNQSLPDFHSFSGEDGPVAQSSSADKDLELEAGQIDSYSETSTQALQDIAFKCETKVLFSGEKIGEGVGRTRREAQHQAAEGPLLYLAVDMVSNAAERLAAMQAKKRARMAEGSLEQASTAQPAGRGKRPRVEPARPPIIPQASRGSAHSSPHPSGESSGRHSPTPTRSQAASTRPRTSGSAPAPDSLFGEGSRRTSLSIGRRVAFPDDVDKLREFGNVPLQARIHKWALKLSSAAIAASRNYSQAKAKNKKLMAQVGEANRAEERARNHAVTLKDRLVRQEAEASEREINFLRAQAELEKKIQALEVESAAREVAAVAAFKESEEQADLIMEEAVNYLETGFYRCLGQCLQTLPPETDLSFLDVKKVVHIPGVTMEPGDPPRGPQYTAASPLVEEVSPIIAELEIGGWTTARAAEDIVDIIEG